MDFGTSLRRVALSPVSTQYHPKNCKTATDTGLSLRGQPSMAQLPFHLRLNSEKPIRSSPPQTHLHLDRGESSRVLKPRPFLRLHSSRRRGPARHSTGFRRLPLARHPWRSRSDRCLWNPLFGPLGELDCSRPRNVWYKCPCSTQHCGSKPIRFLPMLLIGNAEV